MLGDKSAGAVIAVKDMAVAKKFYEETLGFKKMGGDDQMGISYKSGDSMVLVYPSEFAGTNKATALGWVVGDDFDKIMADLKSKGVTFEKFDLPGTTWEGDVAIMGDMKGVWFKDPDGNILNFVNHM